MLSSTGPGQSVSNKNFQQEQSFSRLFHRMGLRGEETGRFCIKEITIMNKKILRLLALMLCAVMTLTACGSKETSTDNGSFSGKSDRVVIYTAAED